MLQNLYGQIIGQDLISHILIVPKQKICTLKF
jgi:hypothetical protein